MIYLIIIALSLSVDAFSLSLAYGLMRISNIKIFVIAFLTGVFHFFMPLLGKLLGTYILKIILIDIKYIIVFIFLLIIVEMIKSLKDATEEFKISLLSAFLFAFAVSIDSFSVGIGITYFTSFPFSIFSKIII